MVLSMKNNKIIIIGAGPCGLGALWQFKQLGYTDIHLFEQSNHAGGVSSTHIDAKGFIWDIGGHVLASKNKDFLEEIKTLYSGPLEYNIRHAWVRIGSTMVPYPIQYHTGEFSHEAHPLSPKSSFYHWVIQSFGSSLARAFFLPFNRKLWKYPLTKMSTAWIQNKIPQHPKEQMSRRWGVNASFYYPSQGGIGSIWNEIAGTLKPHILYNKQVVAIDAKQHTLSFLDHSKDTYDLLLSTMPLPNLAHIVKGIAIPQVSTLPYVGIIAVGVGIAGKPPKELHNCHWIYIPDPTVPYFRVSVYSHYGVGNAPQGTWSLLFEITVDPKTPIHKKNILEETLAHARLQGLIPSGSKILCTFFHHEPFGYPIPTIGRDRILLQVYTLLEHHGIFCRGRFGAWKYEEGNMDDAWIQGGAWARSCSIL